MLAPLIAKRVKLVGLDVDGVLTDGGVYIGGAAQQRIELKRFAILDNLGVRLLKTAGIKVAILSGRLSPANAIRAGELEVAEFAEDDQGHKLPAFEAMLQRLGLRMEEAAFVGDDLPDLPILKRVGLPVAVQNAVPEVKEVAQFTTTRGGGHGAVREFTEVLLRAREQWEHVLVEYLRERGDTGARLSGGY